VFILLSGYNFIFKDWHVQTMFHPCKNLLLCAGLLVLITGCGQKGPLFLTKQQNPEPALSEKTGTIASTANEKIVDELTQQPEEVNNINAE